MKMSMKLVYQYMAIFVNLSPTSNHLYPLQVENCDSNSRLVVDEDDNGKSKLERVKSCTADTVGPIIGHVFNAVLNEIKCNKCTIVAHNAIGKCYTICSCFSNKNVAFRGLKPNITILQIITLSSEPDCDHIHVSFHFLFWSIQHLQPFHLVPIAHIAISILPGTHLHLCLVKHVRVKCLA